MAAPEPQRDASKAPADTPERRPFSWDLTAPPQGEVPSTAPSPPASLLAAYDGRYTEVAELARGGMGRVLLAEDAVLRREVAVKELLSKDDNSLLRATTVTGNGHTAEALPIDKTMEILRRHGVIH